MTSEVDRARPRAFVAEHLPEAQRPRRARSRSSIDEPERVRRRAADGLPSLADPAYAAEQERVAPGSGAVIGVRWPLVRAVERQLRARCARRSSVDRALARPAPRREPTTARCACSRCRACCGAPARRPGAHLAAHAPPGRTARATGSSVDALADLCAHGRPRRAVPLGRARAARLLERAHGSDASSARRWRRLPHRAAAGARAAATLAPTRRFDAHRIAHRRRRARVQKALSWALREWTRGRRRRRRASFLREEARRAPSDRRRPPAWVIRDALTRPADRRSAAELRATPGRRPAPAAARRRPATRGRDRRRGSRRSRSADATASWPGRVTATRRSATR